MRARQRKLFPWVQALCCILLSLVPAAGAMAQTDASASPTPVEAPPPLLPSESDFPRNSALRPSPQLRPQPSWETEIERAGQLESDARELEEVDAQAAAAGYVAAARRYEVAASTNAAKTTFALWRGSRCYWLAADLLPSEDKEGRIERFALSEKLATRALEIDPDCAECMLWKFASMGRLSTTTGVLGAMRNVSVMAELLDRGIELQPDYADSEWNSTLGNLYYSRAIFNRVLPEWIWLKWVLGVRGDKEQALVDSKAALALHPTRLDYRIEVGSQLMCLGSTRSGQDDRLAEGRKVLEDALTQKSGDRNIARDIEAAKVMLASPEKSCGYTGDGWVELDEQAAKRSDN